MAEVLRSFDQPIRDESGSYHARVVGRLADDGMWEGWMEFVSIGVAHAKVLVSPAESRQPEREYLQYWASGLTLVYAEGALQRAKRPLTVSAAVVESAASDAPAKPFVETPPRQWGHEPVLDPFAIGGRSLDILSQELGALNRPRLLNIIAAYDLARDDRQLQAMSDSQLSTLIVTAVESRLTSRSR